MDETIYRTKQEVKEEPRLMQESGKVEDVVFDEVDIKPSEMVEVRGKPMLVEMIENLDFAFGQFDTKEQSLEIDEFINSEIERLKLKDDKESYKKILDKYLNKYSDVYSALEDLIKKIRIDKKIIEASKEKEELLNSDPTTLSSTKLMQRFNLKRI